MPRGDFLQLSTLAIEQDIYNLKKECEEKDATIKELSTFLQSSEVAGSKVPTPLLVMHFSSLRSFLLFFKLINLLFFTW